MANKDLINLGYSPDSGTGDSARRGGEKINTLFSDLYTQFGDNPVGQDPSQPFYGYRRPFFEYEYKVGELHPAGRFIPIEFKTTNSRLRIYDSEYGYGYDNTGTLIDTNGDGIPDIYRDSEWYFLSRGEQIDADLRDIDSDAQVHFVLPIGVPGDQIIIRDGFGTWNNTINDKGIHVSFWTTPFEFESLNQIEEWEKATQLPGTDLDSETLAVLDPISGYNFRSNWHKVKTPAAISAVYPKLDQPFAMSRSTDPYDGLAPTYVVNSRRYQYEFLFSNYNEGWIMRQVALDAADVGATLLQFGQRLDAVDSDLDRGLYVSADSDLRYSVPIFRRTPDGREIHGTLALRGDNDSVMTTIDSEDTALINDPRAGVSGDTVQPLTTTVRFKLRDDVKIKNNLFVGNDLEVGHHLQVGETLTIDSDLAYFNNRLQVHEHAIFDSDVLISGELRVMQQSVFEKDVRFNSNIWVAGDSVAINSESLRVADNLITLSTNAHNAPILDTGLIFQRFDATDGVNTPLVHADTLYNPFMVWDEVNDKFTFGETVSSDSEQVLVKNRIYAEIGRGEFVLYDSENDARVTFEKAKGWPDDVRGSGAALLYPNERPTVEPDYEFVVKANASFGRDSDDVVVFNSRIMSNLVPFGDEVYSLGDSDNKWKDLYLAGNTIHLGSIKIKDVGGQIYFTDSDDNRINLDGSAFAADSITVDSDIEIGGNSLLLGELHVLEHARFDSDLRIVGTVHSDSFKAFAEDGNAPLINFHDPVYLHHGLAVDSDVIISADLRVDSDVIIKGTMSVGQEATFSDDVFFMDNAYFDSDVMINGSLTVNGTTTYVNSQNLGVRDSLITLNYNQTTPFNDIGFIFTRYDSDSVTTANWNAIFEWDETADEFVLGETNGSGILPNPSVTMRYQTFGSGWNNIYDSANTLRTANTYGATNTSTVTGNYTLDVSGDITFDADGNDFVFKNGGGGDTSTMTLQDNSDFVWALPGDLYVRPTGDDVYFQGTTSGEQLRLNLGAATQTLTASDDLYLQSGSNTKVVAVGDTTNTNIVTVGTAAAINDGPFVINKQTSDDGDVVYALTGDGTGIIDGGTF